MGEQIQFTSDGQILFNAGQVVFNCECCNRPVCYCGERKPTVDVEFDAVFADPDYDLYRCPRCPEYGTTLFTVPIDPELSSPDTGSGFSSCFYVVDTGICYTPEDAEEGTPYTLPTYLYVIFSFTPFGVDLQVKLRWWLGSVYVGTKHWDSVEDFEADGGCEGMHEGELGSGTEFPFDIFRRCLLVVNEGDPTPMWRINPP